MTYSRFVAAMKVVLSLLALGLLSTLFLVQQKVAEGDSQIPFADVELEKRMKDQQVTAPFFSGKTSSGHLVAFTAETAQPNESGSNKSEAFKMDARFDLANGSTINLSADTALIDNSSHRARLIGDVRIISSNGYTIKTEELISSMRELEVETPGPVAGNGPAGTFSAGQMHVISGEGENETYLFFTKGVKLIYTPKK